MNNIQPKFEGENPQKSPEVTLEGKFSPEFLEELKKKVEMELQKSKTPTKSIGAQKMSTALGIGGIENLARGKKGENDWREGIDGKDPNKW
ncbi:MAG: hypothetical protein AAB770_02385 [Patescibacteria group bacterium]